MGDDLSSSSSSSAASLLLLLPLSLLEATLSTLPLRDVLALSSSSKDLLSLVSSLSFRRLHSLSPPNSSPWFFLFGFNRLLPLKNQSFAFDPSSHSWITLPSLLPPSHNSSSLSAMNGTLFAFAGAKQAQLCIASSPLKQDWLAIEASMAVGRSNPMIGRFFDDPGDVTTSGSIVVAGGIAGDAEEHVDELAVEVYDMGRKKWQACGSMPKVLKGKSLSSAMVGGRFYVGDCEGGAVCWLERGKEKWEEVEVERPKGVISWQWVGSEQAGLLAVALRAGGGVKIYKMEEGGSGMKEVAEMPAELFELFEEEDERQVAVRSCAGGNNLVYVYSESRFKDYAACVCELGERGSRWYRMPSIPGSQHRFNRVVCVSGAVTLSSCI